MDLFNLESYTNGTLSHDSFSISNNDSQIIMDDTDENVRMCEMELENFMQKPMQTSQESKSDATDATQESESPQNSDIEEVGDAGADIEIDIDNKLEELESLFNVNKKGAKPKQKANTAVPKGKSKVTQKKGKAKQGNQSTNTMNAIRFKRTVQIGNQIVETSAFQTISPIKPIETPAPLGRTRSGRLVQKTTETSEPAPHSRNTAQNNVEVIDLISAPPLVLPGVVNLDSDDEDNCKQSKRTNTLVDSSFDENYEMPIKMRWNGIIKKFPLRRHQRFGDLMEELAKEENVDIERVVITLSNDQVIIKSEDTPDSINYNISMILHGRVISPDLVVQQKGNKKARRDKNMIKVRLQADSLKQPLEIFINKTWKFSSIRHTIAEELKVDSELLKLKFDGEIINSDETPEDLDFDGGEMIDCITMK